MWPQRQVSPHVTICDDGDKMSPCWPSVFSWRIVTTCALCDFTESWLSLWGGAIPQSTIALFEYLGWLMTLGQRQLIIVFRLKGRSPSGYTHPLAFIPLPFWVSPCGTLKCKCLNKTSEINYSIETFLFGCDRWTIMSIFLASGVETKLLTPTCISPIIDSKKHGWG